jgi:hypothetical protein
MMSIRFQCPGCGKRYQLDDAAAGKQAQCRCGQTMHVPGPASEGPPAGETSGAGEASGPSSAGPQAGGSASGEDDARQGTASDLAAGADDGESPERPRWRDVPPRILVGVLAIVYGAVAVLIVPMGLFQSSGMIGLLQPVAAVLIVVGGVLVLRGHEHGPAFAGLSCAILCFFPLLSAVQRALALMGAVRPGALLALVLETVLLYAVPVFIVAWTVREETRKQAESDRID